ncbi:MAG: hypothetical protein ACTSRZ_05310 [Promethearchaeota archaeon]
MRRIRKNKEKLINLLILILIIIPTCLFGLYINQVMILFHSMVEFTYETPPDPSTFIEANYTRLAELANYYDYRYENYHIPLNFSTDTLFKDENCTQVDEYIYSDNGAQFTGLALTGWIFKYLAGKKENNSEIVENASRVIRKLVHGMSMLLAVPNGGLGPDYPGILARGYAGPQHKDIAEFYFEDGGGRHHNGTRIYSNWRWRGNTSNDEHSGFYSALALLLKYVDLPDVQEKVKMMILQLANYMLKNNFLGIDYHGGLTGVDQRARGFQGGSWVCLLLKMAAIVEPSNYKTLYYHYAAEEFYALWSRESGEQESVSNYYAYAFGYHVVFSLILLENESKPLHDLYLKKFEESLWAYTKYHRNPFFNVIRLILSYKPGENEVLEDDLKDILMRWETYHFPDRLLGHKELTSDYYIVDNFKEVREFLDTNPFAFLFRPIFMEIRTQEYLNKPLTPEYRDSNIFLWERNPYIFKEALINPKYEFTGSSFAVPYWMARAFGFIKPN